MGCQRQLLRCQDAATGPELWSQRNHSRDCISRMTEAPSSIEFPVLYVGGVIIPLEIAAAPCSAGAVVHLVRATISPMCRHIYGSRARTIPIVRTAFSMGPLKVCLLLSGRLVTQRHMASCSAETRHPWAFLRASATTLTLPGDAQLCATSSWLAE